MGFFCLGRAGFFIPPPPHTDSAARGWVSSQRCFCSPCAVTPGSTELSEGFGVVTLPSWLQGLALEGVEVQGQRLGTDTVKCLSLSLGCEELSPSHRSWRLGLKSFLCGAVWVRQLRASFGRSKARGEAQGAHGSQHLLAHSCLTSWSCATAFWMVPLAEWQSRSSVLSVPSPAQGRAWLGAQSWGGGQGPHWQHLLLYTTQRCKAALQFFSGQHCLF